MTEKVAVFDRPQGQRIDLLHERDFPRTAALPDGAKGVPIYAEDGGVIEVALPGGRTGWISKAAAITTTPQCIGVAPPNSVPGRAGYVARGAGDKAC